MEQALCSVSTYFVYALLWYVTIQWCSSTADSFLQYEHNHKRKIDRKTSLTLFLFLPGAFQVSKTYYNYELILFNIMFIYMDIQFLVVVKLLFFL